MLRVQRMIQNGCNILDYYMNNIFVFRTNVFSTAYGNLNEIDREIFYDKSKVFKITNKISNISKLI